MSIRIPLLIAVPAAVLASSALSYDDGTLPGRSGIAADSARGAPSCTSCHRGTIGGSGVATRMTVSAFSLGPGERIQVQVDVSGGVAGTTGGFVAENSAGTFVAAANTRASTAPNAGRSITHASDRGRTWSFGYTAPSAPGLVELRAVAMAADGDGGTRGDLIAFHGSDPTATTATPVYLGINALGVQRFGVGCAGSFGNQPVLYAATEPLVGNPGFALSLAGAAPASSALFLLGLPRTVPLDLTPIGGSGCSLSVDTQATLASVTSAGDARRGEGAVTVGLPIPANPALRGGLLAVQAAVVDLANGRALPLSISNGLVVQLR